MPEVSVIIPTYNRAKFVTKAIDSVLAQTYKDYEIIVIDDGSTDNTQEVLEPYMDKITYMYQENAGVSAARNAGIRATTGQWIAFLDSDDKWMPEKLSIQMECLSQNNAKVCFTANVCFTNSIREEGQFEDLTGLSQKEVKEQIFAEPFDLILRDSFWLSVQTMVIEKKLLEKVGCFDERLKVAEDTRLIYNLAFEVPFAFIDEPLTVVNRTNERQGLINDSTDVRKALCNAHIEIISEAYFCCSGKDISIVRKLRRMLGHFLSVGAVMCCVANNSQDAKRLAKDALYFGAGWRVYSRSLVVLSCPWFVRWYRKKT